MIIHVSDMPVFDCDELLTRCMQNRPLAQRVVAKFQQQFPLDLRELQQLLDAGNTEPLARTAHRLKGAAANLAAPALRQVAEHIELAARHNELQTIPAYLDDLQQQWDRFYDEARRQLDTESPPTA